MTARYINLHFTYLLTYLLRSLSVVYMSRDDVSSQEEMETLHMS